MHVPHELPATGSPPPGRPDELRALFARAFQTGAARVVGDVDALRDSVCAYARRRRAEGEPPERVVIELKEMIGMAGSRANFLEPERRALVDGVIRWCIEEYYRAD